MVTVISLFAGIGGSSTGYAQAGLEVVAANEYDARVAAIYRENHPETRMIEKPVEDVAGDDLVPCDVLDGSPPCQGFSLSGPRRADDRRNRLWLEYLRVLDAVTPSVVLMENSAAISKGYGRHYVKAILSELRRRGFHVTYALVNAAYYGVPQNRLRFIVVGQKSGEYRWPEHHPLITVREAFAGLPADDVQYLDRFGHYNKCHKLLFNLKPGQNGAAITGRKYFNWRRLDYDRPAPTLMASSLARGMAIHPEFNRPISVNEMKRLSTFPDDYIFDDYYWAGFGMGNAVPPNLIHRLAANFDV